MISIIIPVYNVDSYIRECLESVANQRGIENLHMECLIVDDCGKDHSIVIAKEFVSEYKGNIEFKIIYREKNGGLSAARNTGINAAQGEYLFFLDSDDYLLPDAIYNLYSMCCKYPEIDLIQGEIQVSEPTSNWDCLNISAATLQENISGNKNCRKALLFDMPMTAWAKLIRREFLVTNKLYYVEGIIHEDDMWCLMASRYINSIAFCFIPIYYYRVNIKGSIMNNKDKTQSYLSYLMIGEKAFEFLMTMDDSYYLYYFMRIINVERKYNIWSQINDKELVTQKIKSINNKIMHSHCSSKIKFAVWYLSLSPKISFNKFSLYVYRRILRLL